MLVSESKGSDVVVPNALEESLIMSRFPQWQERWVGLQPRFNKPTIVDKMTYAPHLRYA